VRHRQDRSGSERVTVDGCHRRHTEPEQPREQPVHLRQESAGLRRYGGQPVDVDAVGVELLLPGSHQRGRARGRLDPVQYPAERIQPALVEQVLPAIHVQDPDRALAVQIDYWSPPAPVRIVFLALDRP
jgi:hypothetical protein